MDKTTDETNDNAKIIQFAIDPNLHKSMKEIARRRQQFIGAVYAEAIQTFLQLPQNYMGKD